MATTTNYSWTTPDDTDLVKDGAAAIRTLGTAIDSTVFTNAGAAINKSLVDAAGDLIYGTADNTVARLGIGTAGQVLQVNSGATAPEWATVSSGGMTLIQETVASAVSSITFGSIPGTYKQLLLIWSGIKHSAGSSNFTLRFNNNSGTVYHSINYEGRASTFDVDNTNSSSPLTFLLGTEATSADAWGSVNGSILIDNYASSTKLKWYDFNTNFYDINANQRKKYTGTGYFSSTTEITSLDVVRTAGAATISNNTNTSIRLYGIS
jgi:hypothetical protein